MDGCFPATILAGYVKTTQLFGVKPYASDILVATLAPARKAATLEPIRALRTD